MYNTKDVIRFLNLLDKDNCLQIEKDLTWAIKVLKRNGFNKGSYHAGDPVNGPVCALGAIRHARSGGADKPVANCTAMILVNYLARANYNKELSGWNDDPTTTRDDVINLFRAGIVLARLHGEDKI